MIEMLVYLAAFVIFVVAAWYILSQLSLPEPLQKMLMIVFVAVGAIVMIIMLLQFSHVPLR